MLSYQKPMRVRTQPAITAYGLQLPFKASIVPKLAAALIAVSTLASLAYIWCGGPLALSPDEAHYWDWSRHLDWSYYSKGPLVAWLMRASCELLGPLSIALTGDLAAAVRTPTLLCHAALLTGWYVLSAGIFRSPLFGLAVVAFAALLPLVRAGSILMTIDPPLLACWCWALICVWKALESERVAWWIGAALLTTVGILAKYTMLLFPAAVVGYLLFHRRAEFRRPGIWLLLAGAVLGWVPVIAWNAAHDWVSFRHVFQQVGLGKKPEHGIRWDGLAHYALGQFGMMFGLWLVAFLGGAWRFRPQRETDTGIRLLWWVSVPVWLLFLVASLKKPGQANWPAPAYVGGFVLAVAWCLERVRGSETRWAATGLVLTIASGLIVTMLLHFPGLFRPTIARICPEPTVAKPFPVRLMDVTARVSGWKELAGEVDQIRDRIRRETGQEPVLAGTYWTVPGVIGCYCQGQPQVYAIGVANGSDRYSQYDLWRPNPVADAQAFRGRTFIIVGDIGPGAAAAFDRLEPAMRVVHSPAGVPVAAWAVWVGHGFRGFDHAQSQMGETHY